MSWPEIALLVVAGIGGGLAGSIAGLASVTTYPALLAVGLPPVTANITNTVALVFNGIGSILGSRPELKGQGRRLLRTVPIAVLGGAAGAALLLSTPAEGFEKIVPILLAFSAVAIVLPVRPKAELAPGEQRPRHRTLLIVEGAAIFLIAVYGGYFGAAAGVLLLALLLRVGSATLPHANASKNVLLGASNSVAALIFVIVADVDWAAVVPLGLGCLIGSRLGPIVVRHAPATPIRILIGLGGLALAVKLGIDAYA
ncbi:sulfite exporter TauE/SafE family protein [soil metagenome]